MVSPKINSPSPQESWATKVHSEKDTASTESFAQPVDSTEYRLLGAIFRWSVLVNGRPSPPLRSHRRHF